MSALKEKRNESVPSDGSFELRQFHQRLIREKRMVIGGQVGLILLIMLVWEFLVRVGVFRELFIGQPSKVVSFLVSMASDGSLFAHSKVTIIETIVGFLVGFSLGSACGLLLWWSRILERVLDPIMVALNSLPKIALTPIFLVWFGVGFKMKLALSLSTVFLVAFLTAAASLGSIDKELVQLTVALGGNRWQIFRKIVIPTSIPWLISAMKISIGFGLTGAVVGEFVASNEGIGYLLMYAAQLYEMSMVWAGVFILVVVAVVMYVSVVWIERVLLRWQER